MKVSRRQVVTGLIVSSASLYLLDRQFNLTGLQTGTVEDIFGRVDESFTAALADAFKAETTPTPKPSDLLPGIVGDPAPTRLDALVDRIRSRIQDDYKSFRVLNVQGWELSHTECALGYYLESRRADLAG